MPVTSYSHSKKRVKSEAANARPVFLAALILALVAGVIFLATRDIPAPRHAIQKAIPNDRLFK